MVETLTQRVTALESRPVDTQTPQDPHSSLKAAGPGAFHAQLRSVLRRASRTQEHLASTLGITPGHLSNLLKGSKGEFLSYDLMQ